MNRIITKALAAAALAAAFIIPVACTTGSQTDQAPIDRHVAIMIAEANVPSSATGVSVLTLWNQSNWIVNFRLSTPVTRSELGWPESPNNRFVNQGRLPAGTYDLLTFTIDRSTGTVVSRQASDSVLLGGPGVFNTEPPGTATLPLWTAIAIGIGGLMVGAITVLLITRRRMTKT